jgi:hypothetical protein
MLSATAGEACKAVYTGSIPVGASPMESLLRGDFVFFATFGPAQG